LKLELIVEHVEFGC